MGRLSRLDLSSPRPNRHSCAAGPGFAVRYYPRTVVSRRAKCCVLKAVRNVRSGMRLFRLIIEVARLFTAIAVLEFERAYKKGTGNTVYDYRWSTVDIAQKELFNSPKSGLDIVTWRGVGAKTQDA